MAGWQRPHASALGPCTGANERPPAPSARQSDAGDGQDQVGVNRHCRQYRQFLLRLVPGRIEHTARRREVATKAPSGLQTDQLLLTGRMEFVLWTLVRAPLPWPR